MNIRSKPVSRSKYSKRLPLRSSYFSSNLINARRNPAIIAPDSGDKPVKDTVFPSLVGLIKSGSFSIMALKSKRNVPFLTRIYLFKQFFEHLVKNKPDILIFDYINAPVFLLFRMFVKTKGIMLILSRPVSARNWLNSLLFKLFLVIGNPYTKAFTAITPFEAWEYSKLGGISIDKIKVIPSTIGRNFEEFIQAKNPSEYRLKFGLDALIKKKVAIYHGVLTEEKGVTKLVQLFSKSFKNNDDIVLLIVGDGPAKGTIKAYLDRINKIFRISLITRRSWTSSTCHGRRAASADPARFLA